MTSLKFDIRPVLEHYGAHNLPSRLRGWASIKCIVHDDSNASASFSEADNKYHCFSCGFHGDALDIIQEKEGGDLASAIERATEIAGDPSGELSRSAFQPGRRKPVRLSDRGAQAPAGNPQTVRTGGRRKPRRIG